MLSIILIVVLVVALFGVLPMHPYSANYGYGPSGIVGVLLVILIIYLLLGHRL